MLIRSTETTMKIKSILLFLHFAVCMSADADECSGVEIVSRREWRARPPWRVRDMKLPLSAVIVQHTASTACRWKAQCMRVLQMEQDYHMDSLGFSDIGYNFLVGGDGRVYEGRGWRMFGAHSYNFNTVSLGIAFMGNFMEVEPSKAMLDAALGLIDCGVEKGYLAPTRAIHGHRDVLCTLSPGDRLYEVIRHWKNFQGGRVPGYNCETSSAFLARGGAAKPP